MRREAISITNYGVASQSRTKLSLAPKETWNDRYATGRVKNGGPAHLPLRSRDRPESSNACPCISCHQGSIFKECRVWFLARIYNRAWSEPSAVSR